MRNLLPILLLLFTFGCSKEKDSEPLPVFRFKANGIQYDWSGKIRVDSINGGKGAGIARYYYVSDPTTPAGYKIVSGDLRNNGANRLYIDILRGADSLLPKKYFYRNQQRDGNLTELTIGTWAPNDAKGYINGLSQDSVSVNITSIKNGMAAGTFYASLTQVGPLTDMNITDGQFENLPIVEVK